MQPSPRAETSKSLFPSLRFCILNSCIDLKVGTRGLVLFVADLLHPLDDFAVALFLNGDMGHGRGRRGAMPMLFFRRAPDHVARSYFHFWTAFALHPPTPRRDDQGLPKRVGVPCRPGA